MPRSCLTCLLVLFALTACACDDPAPIVLGRLHADARDAGDREIDAAHEREHEHEAGHSGREADEAPFERE